MEKSAAHQVVAIYKGHDIAWYRQATRGPLGIQSSAKCVCHHICGRNRPHKGIDFLVDAARYLPAETPVFFLLLGRLENDRKLRAKIDTSPMKDRFILAGFRNNAPAIFAASDAFIMPSTKREGLSRAVIEAMSSETVPL